MHSKRLCSYEKPLDDVFVSGKMPDGRPCGDLANVEKAWTELKEQFCPSEVRQ